MVVHLRCYILIIFSFISLGIDAQEEIPFHVAFTTEDGLPSNRVYDIMQDSKGYIWAATDNGLIKFNGQKFKEYTTTESVNSEYSYLHELKDGSIWCINFGNQVLKVSGDSLKVVDVFKPYINDRKYFKLHEWKDSLLYLQSQNRILEYDIFHKKIKEIQTNKKNHLDNFYRDQKSIFFSYANTSLDRKDFIFSLDNQSLNLQPSKYYPWLKVYHSNGLSFSFTLIEEEGYSSGHLFPFSPYNTDPIKKENSILSTKQNHFNTVSSVTYLSGDNIWMSTKEGCFNTLRETPLFPNYHITKIIRDAEGNHWLSTYNSGIFFIPNLNNNQISSFQNGISQIEKINDSELILGTIDGDIIIYDFQKKEIKRSIFIGDSSLRPFILLDENKKLHVRGTKPYILNLQNNKTYPSRHMYSVAKNSIKIGKHSLLVQNGKNDVMLYDTRTWKNRIKPSLKLSHHWKTTLGCKDSLSLSRYCGFRLKDNSKNIENIHYEKNNKRIWIAYTNKTAIESKQTFKYFTDEDGKDLQLNCFADYFGQGVIAAKRNHGLIFIKDNRIISSSNHKTYEIFGAIRKIITTDSLIISLAKKGIIISDKNGIPLYTLDETDGLKGSIINNMQFYSDELWIGTTKGLHSIRMNHLHDNLTAPKVYINQILVNQKETNLSSSNNLSIPNNSDVEINYEAISFKGRKVFHYEYKLHQDEDWKTLSNSSNSIRFPNLSSDKYQFHIRAINEEGLEGKPTILNFKVLPPFWLRWWFILGSITLIATILFFYNKRNLERIEKENQLEKERIERENQLQQEIRSNKLSALQSRMNPHFIFNSLNSIQDFIIKLDKEGANEYLGIFSDLMRIYLSHSEQDNIEIQEEIEALQLYLKLEELRFGDITVDFHIDHQLKDMDIHLPPLFIQPYIENAFKHGLLHKRENKKLIIAFKLIKNQLIIHIEDNGVGRAKVKEIQNKTTIKGLSYSTKANQTRLELLNHNRTSIIKVNTIDLYNKEIPSGTLVKITIPLLDY